MAFIFNKSLTKPNFPNIVKKPTTASEAYVDGEGLVITAGALTKVGATAKPEYIAAETYTAPATGMKEIAVYPVLPSHEYLTTFAADATAVTAGTKVTIHTDGGQATATSTSGVATIVKKLGTGAVGTKAIIRFI